jgi:HSP20 family protein
MQREGAKGARRSGYVLGGPLRQFWSVMQEMSRMLEVAHGAEARPGSGVTNVTGVANVADVAREWEPRVTEMPVDGDIVMYFELPGVEREDVDLALYGDSLMVSGVKKDLPSLENVTVEDFASGDLDLGPVHYSPFKRTVQLPSLIEEEDIEAAFGAGLLQVRLTGAAESRSRRIHVRGGRRSLG